MKKKSLIERQDELRPEYDLRALLKKGVRGKYAKRFQPGTNLVVLEPDVAKVFADAEAVNQACGWRFNSANFRRTRSAERPGCDALR